MIFLTKINSEKLVINCDQIEAIEAIPESKVLLMNGESFIVMETPQEIIDKTIQYRAEIYRQASVREKRTD